MGRRKLMTMDEVLRMDTDKALVIIRGKKVLEVDKYDYSKHPGVQEAPVQQGRRPYPRMA